MWSKRPIAGLLVMLLALTGCASIVGKNIYPLTINSYPSEATIVVTDEAGRQMYRGRTPTTVTLASGEAYFHAKRYTITFSREGYQDQVAEVRATLSGWYFGNIVFGGLIGLLIVDPITGNMWKLPTDVTATLAERVASNPNERILRIASLQQIPESERKHLVKLN